MSGAGLRAALVRSWDADAWVRLSSIAELRRFLPDPAAHRGLAAMLEDEIVTVEVEAAEALVRFGGMRG